MMMAAAQAMAKVIVGFSFDDRAAVCFKSSINPESTETFGTDSSSVMLQVRIKTNRLARMKLPSMF